MSSRYQHLYQQLREAINLGHYQPGQRLPASRVLAKEQGVSRNTVVRAYEMLVSEGYLTSHIGDGMRVSHDLPHQPWLPTPHIPASTTEPVWSDYGQRLNQISQASPRDFEQWFAQADIGIDFQYGQVTMGETMALQWRRLAAKWSRLQSEAYGDPQGLPALREALAAHLSTYRGCRSHADNMMIGSSAQQLFTVLLNIALGPNDTVVIEEPWYQRFKDLLVLNHIHTISVPVDNEGLCLNTLHERTIAQGIVPKLIYVTPSHQFPAGVVMSLQRRLALLDWCAQHECWVIEDDYVSEFRYSGPPIDALQSLDQHGRVLYLGTTSKAICPSLRIAYGLLPTPWIPKVKLAIQISHRHASWMEQHMLAECISEGIYVSHIRRQRRRYESQRSLLVEQLLKHFGDDIEIQGESAGLHILVWFKHYTRQQQAPLLQALAQQGVAVYPIDYLYTQASTQLGLLMGYATLEHAQIIEGVDILQKTLKHF